MEFLCDRCFIWFADVQQPKLKFKTFFSIYETIYDGDEGMESS